ncbi:barstar family protein [Streptomyces sp. NBC_01789]|uniref:barstar family protein n=1 Tax=Streptomyces sp. NBC_01789 TaxID=2975941 RepID=UPI0022513375|nr:barstar family protein [Streptomyces sp. NBC_01789]MCX4451753.1 barstar family protein [Streptomyces sp. NBC_01789]
MRIVIDGAHIGSQADLHRVLAGPLDFGPYYGHNLSALWDRLSRDVERPVEIVCENAAVSRGRMGDEAFETIASVLVRAAAEDEANAPNERLTMRFT